MFAYFAYFATFLLAGRNSTTLRHMTALSSVGTGGLAAGIMSKRDSCSDATAEASDRTQNEIVATNNNDMHLPLGTRLNRCIR